MRFFVIIVVSFFPAIGRACSCLWPDAITESYVLDRFCAADAIFVGDVDSVLRVRDDVFEYKIWPRESFKGQLSSPIFAISKVGGMCGYPFKDMGRYLIFANYEDKTNYLSASICGLTRQLVRDDPVYAVLASNKADTEEICGEEAVAERRLERVREKNQIIEKLEEDTQEHLDSEN
jgi:hypothetical protein